MSSSGEFMSKIKSATDATRSWAKRDFGNIFSQKQRLMARLGGA